MQRLILVILLCFSAMTIIAQDDLTDKQEFLTTPLPTSIVYLVNADNVDDEISQAAAVEERFDAVIFHNYEDFEYYRSLFLVEAIIIHPSALEFLDHELLREAYDSGTVVTMLNISSELTADLLSNPSLADRYEMVDNDIIYITTARFRISSSGGGGSMVGRFGDAIETEAFPIGIWMRIDSSRSQKLRAVGMPYGEE